MRRALEALDGPLLESELLGTLMIVPYLRLDCGTLRPADFSSPHRGAAFQAIMTVKHPELGLVVDHLERTGAPPPPGRTGWGDALARVLDVAFVEDEAVPLAVKAIKEAAIARRAERRQRVG
jgi:hypothetical protein